MKTPMTKLMLAAAAATLLCLGTRAEFTLDDGLVAYYKFDGDIADSSGNGYDWTGTAATWTTDRGGEENRAALFSGSGTLTPNDLFGEVVISNSLTIAVWVKPSGTLPADLGDFTEEEGHQLYYSGTEVLYPSHGGFSAYAGVGLYVGTNGIAVSRLKDCLNPPTLLWYNAVGENWIHVVITISDNGGPVLYVNGVPEATGSQLGTGEINFIGGKNFYSNSNSSTHIGEFCGALDEMRFYDRALGAEEVAKFMGTKTITWLNDDSSEIDTTEVEYGLMPEHADATKASDADFDYFFAGWSPELAEVESNTTYTVVFLQIPRVHSTGGDAEWSMDAEEGALRSGAIGNSGNTWFRTSVPRPCVFTFKWKTSSEDSNDKLGFTINGADAYDTEGNKIEPISGVKDNWATVSVVVSNSMDVLEWKYWKDGSETGGQDCAWIKDFEMTPFEGEVRTLSVVPNYDSAATVNAYAEKDCVMGVFPTVARYGYAFLGYFTAAECGEEVEPPYPLSADTTLYAHWAKTSDFETTGGDGDWIIEEDGITWRSGAIGDIQKTWATYTVKRPCAITYKWKTSTEANRDELKFYVDNVQTDAISGETDWADISLTFEDSKNHVLKWEYSKDTDAAGTYDCGWIRDFVVTPCGSWAVTRNLNYEGAGELETRYVKKGNQLDVNEFPPMDEPRAGYTCWWALSPWTGDVLTNAVDISADTTLYAHWVKQYGFKEFDETCQEAWRWLDDGSIRTGMIGDQGDTWATISVTGPCDVSFKWKTSSESNWDKLHFYVDGSEKRVISGEMTEWESYQYPESIAEGDHVLKWTYTKDGSGASGEDCGWIKDVVITKPDSAPYTVTWQNADGTALETDTDLAAGAVPAYNSALPTLAATAQYTYEFAGWEQDFELVSSNTVYTAKYTAALRSYDVTWLDEDGTQLGTTNIVYGATPVYDGEPPTKEATAQYTYTFAGWTPEVTTVTGDATYTATYTQTLRYYTVTWNDENGNKLGSDTLPYGETPSRADPTKAATAQYTYTFAGWNPALATVTNDVTYTATYDATVNKYTITFKNYDGSTLQSGLVEYGTTPAYAGVTPTKAATAQFDYTFAGWTPSIVAVTESASYTATYTATSADGWKVLNLSEQTDAYTAQHRDMLTGTLSNNVKISIADGATVLLQNVKIEGVYDSECPWAGITCEGDACLVIEGANYVKGFYTSDDWGYPGVSVPEGKTLTISGTGALEAWGQVHCAGIGGHHYATCGNIVIESGTIIAYAGHHAAGIGAGNGGHCGDITINGGVVKAYGRELSAAIGGVVFGDCGDITINGGDVYACAYGDDRGTGIGSGYYFGTWGAITIGENITKVVVDKKGDIGWHIGGGEVTIAPNLKDTTSGNTRTIEPDIKWDITWRSDEGVIEVTKVNNGATPEYADQEKEAEAPYRYIFTGWSPALEPAVSNTTYMATFQKIADTSLLTEDWQAANGDAIVVTNATAHSVTIPAGASVTINGVTIKGASGGGGVVDAPSFSESGESAVTKFEGAGNTWTLTAFAEMEGDSVGTAVTDGQIKVYAADSVEGLEDAEPVSEGVTVTERKSAVKTTIEVVLPSTPEKQFFKVKFGE